ncbi:cobalamin-5-phosphate synthase-domain-containing protein [Obelidium mucronatum]|nr:cobalamin-5-phosphate synthase-domain-containing protein [Obelidium mucronatum]
MSHGNPASDVVPKTDTPSSHGHGHGHGHGSSTQQPPQQPPPAIDAEPKVPKEEKSSSFIVQEVHAFYSGVMFFTRMSVPKWVNHSLYWLSLSTVYFPVIGVLVALVGFFWFTIAYYLFPGSTIIPPIFYTMATIRFTGGFHEDGLADMCDGFGGGWTKSSILRIMRDSTIGTFGGLGLILFQLMKMGAVGYLLDTIPLRSLEEIQGVVGVVAQLAGSRGPISSLINLVPVSVLQHCWKLAHIGGVLVAGHVFARWSCTYLLFRYKYVENASAVGKEYLLTVTPRRVVMATIFTAVLVAGALIAVPTEEYWIQMAVAWAVTIYVTVGMGRYINRVIGGVIGDCLGATNQIVECTIYLALGVNWIRIFGDAANLYLIVKSFVDSFIKA